MDTGKTELAVSYSLGPLKNIKYAMSGKLGNFAESMVEEFYPKVIGKKVNVLVSELVSNVLENIIDDESSFLLHVEIDGEDLIVRVENVVGEEDFTKIAARITKIRQSSDVTALLADTIRERRKKNLKGGLGLIRLSAESEAELSVSYSPSASLMTITGKFDMRGIA